MNSNKNKANPGFLKTFSTLQFGITVLAAIAIVSIIGTIIPQGRPAGFYQEHHSAITNFFITVLRFDTTFRSPLFIVLLVLLVINLTLCSGLKFPARLRTAFRPDLSPNVKKISGMPVAESIEKKSVEDVRNAFAKLGFSLRVVGKNRLFGENGRLGYLGSTFVHLSIIVFLAGGLVSLVTGQRGQIILEKDQSTSAVILTDRSTIPLGFELKLNRFNVEFYENFPGRPKSYTSYLTVTEPGKSAYDIDLRVNHPLMLNGFTIYQSSYGISEPQGNVSVNDTVKVAIGLKAAGNEMPPIITYDLVMGKLYNVPGFGDSISVSLAEIFRDFKQIQSISGDTNPAVRLDVLINGKSRWNIYAFKNFPGMNMPMTFDLDLLFTMLDIRQADDISVQGEDEFYTVLGVKKDKGITLMWIGAVTMMLGLTFSLYVRPKRIWVLEDNGKILIGAITRSDPESLRDFVKKAVKNI